MKKVWDSVWTDIFLFLHFNISKAFFESEKLPKRLHLKKNVNKLLFHSWHYLSFDRLDQMFTSISTGIDNNQDENCHATSHWLHGRGKKLIKLHFFTMLVSRKRDTDEIFLLVVVLSVISKAYIRDQLFCDKCFIKIPFGI